MDTLVSIGIAAATGWSIYAMFWRDTSHVARSLLFVITHQAGGAIYIDVAAGVTTFLLAGRYFELSSKRRTGNALRSLASLGAKDVAVLDAQGIEHRIPTSELAIADQFVVRPGETVASDGEVVFGDSAVDRSAITGESLPADVGPGDAVIGGTVLVGGRLVVRATSVGSDTQLAHMVRLVEDAQNEKAAVQRLADRISAVFVPTVLAIAIVTLAAWLLAGGSAEHAFSAAISVLIIACPCALGLADPDGTSRGVRTRGEPRDLLQGLSGARGVASGRHRRARQDRDRDHRDDGGHRYRRRGGRRPKRCAAVGRSARAGFRAPGRKGHHRRRGAKSSGALPPVESFMATPGLGARGVVEAHRISVGRAALVAAPGDVVPAALNESCATWEAQGKTVVLVSRDEDIVGALALSDTIRPTAGAAVRQLEALGLHCILLTGDNEETALAVGSSIGVSDVVAGAMPAEKVDLIRRLQREGRSVAMVGDGVNDGPALAVADLGLAIGSGTDVAINAADLIVVRDDLQVVATAIDLARRTLKTIRGNLAWAFAYNVVAIPLAACGLLNPLIAGAAMVFSSGFVVWNSSRLGRSRNRPDQLAALGQFGNELRSVDGPDP